MNKALTLLSPLKLLCLIALLLISSVGVQANASTDKPIVTVESAEQEQVYHWPRPEQWLSNAEDPVFASEKAVRGGRFRSFIPSFPLTLRTVGPDSNGSFAGYMRALNFGLLDFHPNTLRAIPSLASHWAFDDDGRTVYFKLDPDARWSDGVPVTADDYLFTIEFMRSKHIVAPWYNNYYSEQIVDVSKRDQYTIAVRFGSKKPKEELLRAVAISPTPRHFHQLDKNWIRAFNWRPAPVTGPYKVSKVRKGKYVEFERIDDWWGNNKRYYQHRYNPDFLRVKVIRDINVAHQYFTKGELDSFPLVLPNFWHKKANARAYRRGYIGKIKFYNELPQPSYGLYLNEDHALLADRNTRFGLAHSIHMDKVLRTVLRGDYERLETMHEGFGDYSNPDIRARRFDLDAAERHYTLAGWQQRGKDGVRIRPIGKTGEYERLSLDITYMSAAHTPRLVVLKEEALKAGVELNLRLLDGSAGFKQILEKKHQIAWMGWGVGGLSPRYWENFHSDNAHKPQTNNITNTNEPEFDRLIERYRNSYDRQERIALAHQLEQKIHDSGSYIPTYKVPYTRAGFWRWVKLPAHWGTRSSDSLFDVLGSGLLWIDENEKQAVLSARRRGDSLEPLHIVDSRWRKSASAANTTTAQTAAPTTMEASQ